MKYFFLLACLAGIWLAGSCRSPQTTDTGSLYSSGEDCVQRILSQDDSLGNIRNHACERRSLSAAVVAYTTAMEQLDFKQCPRSFSQAFAKHRMAWQRVLPITDRYPDLRGEMHDLFQRLESGPDSTLFKQRVAAIWSTWSEVEQAVPRRPTHLEP